MVLQSVLQPSQTRQWERRRVLWVTKQRATGSSHFFLQLRTQCTPCAKFWLLDPPHSVSHCNLLTSSVVHFLDKWSVLSRFETSISLSAILITEAVGLLKALTMMAWYSCTVIMFSLFFTATSILPRSRLLSRYVCRGSGNLCSISLNLPVRMRYPVLEEAQHSEVLVLTSTAVTPGH